MNYTLFIPDIGDVKEVRMLEWHGQPGDEFAEGDLIAELETHKVVIEVRAGQAGVLHEILVEEGAWQKTMTPMALFKASGAQLQSEPVGGEPDEFAAEFTVA